MISKIHNVRGVGRFRNFESKQGIDLEKLTLIYSDNGKGKSTLADILRSLAEKDASSLLGRHTVGAADQFVKLDTDNGLRCFHNGRWMSGTDDILIFDEIFVTENIYMGQTVGLEHRRNLLPIIIGDVQKRGVIQEEQLKESIKSSNKSISDVRKRIEAIVQTSGIESVPSITFKQFIALSPVADVDTKIENKQVQVDRISDSDRIRSESKFQSIEVPNLPSDDLRRVLRQSLSDVAGDAKVALESHIDAFSGNNMEGWIKDGTHFESESGDTCPFCGQSLGGSDLISHYQAVFDKTYQDFDSEVSTFVTRYINVKEWVSEIKNALETNRVRVTFWAEHLANIEIPALELDVVESILQNTESEMIAVLNAKQSALFKPVELSPGLEAAFARWNTAAEKIREYSSVVQALNRSIDELRVESESGNLIQEKQELVELRYTKLRYSKDVSNDCVTHEEQSNALSDLNDDLSKQQEANSKAIRETFETYGTSLNKYLSEFGAGFNIVELKQTRIGGQMRADYMIALSGEKIALGNEKTDVSKRSFKNVLSEGDKRTLALGFFLSKLDLLEDSSDKVIVFDDPVTSLDENRQLYTSEIIGKISIDADQVIVLSHRPEFLYKVWDHFGNGAKYAVPCKLLEIRHKEREVDSSEIVVDWDIRASVRSAHASNLRRVLDFMQGSYTYEPNYIAMLLRPIMETHFKACYPEDFSGDMNLGSFLGCINSPDANPSLNALKGDVAVELDILNRYLTPSQHNGDLPPSVTRDWVLPYCRRVLAVVGRI